MKMGVEVDVLLSVSFRICKANGKGRDRKDLQELQYYCLKSQAEVILQTFFLHFLNIIILR